MLVRETRFWVKLHDPAGLEKAMRFHNLTIRGLGDQVDRQVTKASKGRIKPKGSWRVIGHLRSGERNTCRPETAHAIEDCLGLPRGFLFADEVSRVSRPQRTAA